MALDVELSETRDFLSRHEPFDALPDAVLDTLPARMSVEYFRRGTRLVERGHPSSHLSVLRSGGGRPSTGIQVAELQARSPETTLTLRHVVA